MWMVVRVVEIHQSRGLGSMYALIAKASRTRTGLR
jgi:hypothetical protein